MRSILRAIVLIHLVPQMIAGCKQWVMKLPQAIHKYPFVRVTSVKLVRPTSPVPAANLKACHALCDKAGCKAFAFYYDQLLCSIAEGYEEDGPRILTPDAVQGDPTLGFYVAAPHDQEKLPYCPSREAYGRYLHDSVRPWLFPELPTTPALPIAASSSSSASSSTPLPSSLKDTTISGRTTTTTPSEVPSTSNTTTSTSFAPSTSITTTSGGSFAPTSTSTTRSTTSTTTASATQTQHSSTTTEDDGNSSSSQQTTPEKEPVVGSSKTTTESSMPPSTVTTTTTISDAPSSTVSTTSKTDQLLLTSSETVSTTSTTTRVKMTTEERESTTTSGKRSRCAIAVNGEKFELANFESKEGPFKQATAPFPSYLSIRTALNCRANVSYTDGTSELVSSLGVAGDIYSVRVKKQMQRVRCECDPNVPENLEIPAEDPIYAGFVTIGDKRFDVACGPAEEIKQDQNGFEGSRMSVRVFGSCQIVMLVKKEGEKEVQRRIFAADEEIDFDVVEKILSWYGYCPDAKGSADKEGL